MRLIAKFTKEVDQYLSQSFLVSYSTPMQFICAKKPIFESLDENFQNNLTKGAVLELYAEGNSGEIRLICDSKVLMIIEINDISPIIKEIKEEIIKTL